MEIAILETVECLVNVANNLYDLSHCKEASPMSIHEYLCKRNGIIFAIKEICEHTQLLDFESLFEKKNIDFNNLLRMEKKECVDIPKVIDVGQENLE